jgi:hypothetical protein
MREDIYIYVDVYNINGGTHVYIVGEQRDAVAFDEKTFYVGRNDDGEYYPTKNDAIRAAYMYAELESARLNCDWRSN